MSILDALLGRFLADQSVLARVRALPSARWEIKLAGGVDEREYLSFSAREDNGTTIVVTRYPAVDTGVYGNETIHDRYRVMLGTRFIGPEGSAALTARQAYEFLRKRLDARVVAYVRDERRKAREEQGIFTEAVVEE